VILSQLQEQLGIHPCETMPSGSEKNRLQPQRPVENDYLRGEAQAILLRYCFK
jgi:hypothetical protein